MSGCHLSPAKSNGQENDHATPEIKKKVQSKNEK